MTNAMAQKMQSENLHILQPQKKMQQHGSAGVATAARKHMTSPINKTSCSTRTGDAVSDESEDGDDEGDGSANEDYDPDSDDEEDDVALSGVRRSGNAAIRRLAGRMSSDINMPNPTTGAKRDESADEDDYGALEEISDDDSLAEVDETDVLRSAEKDLIAEFERTEKPRNTVAMTNGIGEMSLEEDAALARRLSLNSQDSNLDDLDDLDLDLDFNQDPFGGLNRTDHLYQDLLENAEEGFDNTFISWRNPDADVSLETSIPSMTNPKRVRFQESLSSRASSVSSEEDPRDAFPDLFDEHDADRQQMLHNMDVFTDNASEYEFEDDDEKTAFEIDAESDSNSEMSDDESTDGDTTDDEAPEIQIARVKAFREAREKREVMALELEAKNAGADFSVATATPSTPSTPVPARRRAIPVKAKTKNGQQATLKGSKLPKMGTFIVDPTRAAVTANVGGSGVKVVCPSKPPAEDREYWERARQAIGSRDGSPGSVTWTPSTAHTSSIPKRPFTARSTLGTMFNGNFDILRNNDDLGISKELIMMSRKGSVQSSLTSTTLTDGASDTSFDEPTVNMEDFVEMDEMGSEMEDVTASAVFSPVQEHFSDAFPESPIVSRDNAPGLLDHFDQQPGLVSSFRNNQHHARHVSSLAAHPAKRAQTSEANALQKGRRAAANTPITPARKKRVSQDIDATGAGIKKTASPLATKHRRSRNNSLSQTLSLDHFAGNLH